MQLWMQSQMAMSSEENAVKEKKIDPLSKINSKHDPENQNQGHNSKKVAQGPNTKR